MSGLREPGTWQEYLGKLIASPQERARLASKLGMKPVTLQRWAAGESKPRDINIRALLKNLPAGSHALFLRLLRHDFPELLQSELPVAHLASEIPSEFYARALAYLAFTPQPIYRQSMQDLLFQQMLEHLDSDGHGLAITLAACMPPRQGCKVRSLREVAGLATPPWPSNPAEKSTFLGSESLVGYATLHMRPYVIDHKDEPTLLPAHWTEHERGAAAFPLLRQARIAGGLIVSSAQECFFTPPRLALIESYSELADCIFEPEDFYGPNEIELRRMPAQTSQFSSVMSYNQRVSQKCFAAGVTGEEVTLQQIHRLAWQEVEEDLLQLPLSVGATDLL